MPRARRGEREQCREVFKGLFAQKFGPKAVAAFEQQRQNERPPVFGLSYQDQTRMRHYLTTIADYERGERRLLGFTLVGAGLYAGSASAAFFAVDGEKSVVGYIFGGLGAVSLVSGAWQLLRRSEGERALLTFETGLRLPGVDPYQVVAATEMHLERIAAANARWRLIGSISCCVSAAFYAGLGIFISTVDLPEREEKLRYLAIPLYSGAALLTAVGIYQHSYRTPMERILKLYHEDPDLSLSFSASPAPGGATVGVAGQF